MSLLDIVNNTLNNLDKVQKDFDSLSKTDAEKMAEKLKEADELGLSEEEKDKIKNDGYEPTDFEEEPDGNEQNDDDYYSEDN
jgi:AAA+ ATPase superfamily predicted ATPase